MEIHFVQGVKYRGFVYRHCRSNYVAVWRKDVKFITCEMFANIYLCLQPELKEGKHKQFNISHRTFHSLQNTHFPIVKLLSAVHMSDYLSEQAVLCGTRNTRPFSSIQ